MTNLQPKLQIMKKEDINDLFSLWQASGLTIKDQSRENIEVKMMLDKNQSSCFVVKVDQKIIGSVFGTFNGRRGWIYHLAVHPKSQKLGLGKLLLMEAEKALIKQGVTKILFGVLLTNLKTIPFYEKYGYTVMNDSLVLVKDFFSKGETYEK